MTDNILEFVHKKKKKAKQGRRGGKESNVLDFVAKKKGQTEQKQRQFERFLFQNFLGTYCVVFEGQAVCPISLINISKNGCLFQVPKGPKTPRFKIDGETALRLYLGQSGYLSIPIVIKRENKIIDSNKIHYIQYGCEFDRSAKAYDVLSHLVDFLERFSEYSQVDQGDQRVYFV